METEREPTRRKADILATADIAGRVLRKAEVAAQDAFRAAYANGWTADEIAKAAGSSPYKVRKAVKAAGDSLWQHGRRMHALGD